jgi:2-oxoglutarate ferredoxin oxidoreductase subunit beta
VTTDPKDFKSDLKPIWCPGCGDFGVLAAAYRAFAELDLDPDRTVVVSGIGCSSRFPGFVTTYGYHGVHGRALPTAMGVKMANPELEVIAVGGDGDGFAIGGGHFPHAARRNVDITYIVMDNEIYGLTTGQASPTTTEGHKTKSTPRGNVEKPVQPLALALASGATYVARGFSGEQKQLSKLVAGAIAHRGFSLIDVFSPCVTFNKVNTYPFFKERVYKLEDEKGYDTTDLMAAMEKSMQFGARIPIGLLYSVDKPTYEDSEPVFAKGPLVDQPLGLDARTFQDILAETM